MVDKLSENFGDMAKDIMKAVERATRATAINRFNQIIIQSPVDKGRFKANWQVTVNRPTNKELYEGIKKGDEINSYQEASSKIPTTTKFNDKMILTNNVAYAQSLIEGSSKQRPNGWVRRIIENGEQVFSNFLQVEMRKIK